MTEDNYPIVFFDGVCNLCNSSVQVIIRNDKNKIFRFASLQSDFTKQFLSAHNYQIKSDSIILFYGSKFYERSSAALIIAKKLRFPFPLLLIFWIIPLPIRNWLYSLIAKNRYRWFGKQESCMIPEAGLKERFLD